MEDINDLSRLFVAERDVLRWRAERENANARHELAQRDRNAANLISRHEPVASLGIDREVLRHLLSYVNHGNEKRLMCDIGAVMRTDDGAAMQSVDSPRFTPAPDGWWRDAATGLEWSPTAPDRMSHADAVAWCESVGGRLPTVNELVGVLDYSRYDPATELPDTRSYYYWSSTTYRLFPNDAWGVSFFAGSVFAIDKSSSYRVRAVRGGS